MKTWLALHKSLIRVNRFTFQSPYMLLIFLSKYLDERERLPQVGQCVDQSMDPHCSEFPVCLSLLLYFFQI